MKVQLSIAILVSDREAGLTRCLDSLRQLLCELPCELIVVFTGKNKKILETVHQYTDHVIPFEWCDDFSAARNVGLNASKGEWFMFLDDDEWFENTDSICRFFQSGEYRKYNAASYIVRNYTEWSGGAYTDVYVLRMVKRTSEICFRGTIHECLSPSRSLIPMKYVEDFAHHYGYVSKKGIKSGGRAKRNIPLLLEEIEKEPLNGKNYMQLAQEYRNEKDYEKAEKYASKCIEVCAKNKKEIFFYEYWVMVMLPSFIVLRGEPERALETARKLLKSEHGCEFVHMCLYGSIAELCGKMHRDEECLDAVRKFYEQKQYLDAHRELWVNQAMAGVTESSVRAQAHSSYLNGLYCGVRLKDYKSVREILRMIPWNQKSEMEDGHYAAIEEWKENYPEQSREILECFSRLESEDPYIDFQKALYAEKEGDLGRAEEYFARCCEKSGEFIWRGMMEMGVRNGFDITVILKQISLEKWNSYAAAIVRDIELDRYEEYLENYREAFRGFPFHFSCLEQQLYVRLMLEQVHLGERLVSTLGTFCRILSDYYRSLYREENFEGDNVFRLPAICQFGIAIQDTFEKIENENWGDAVKGLRKALDIHPGLSVVIKRLLDHVIEKSEEASRKKGEEFEALSVQIKQALRGMIERQEYCQAEPVIAQLLSLLPNDMEVLKMKQIMLQNA